MFGRFFHHLFSQQGAADALVPGKTKLPL